MALADRARDALRPTNSIEVVLEPSQAPRAASPADPSPPVTAAPGAPVGERAGQDKKTAPYLTEPPSIANRYYVEERRGERQYFEDYQRKNLAMRATETSISSKREDLNTVRAMLEIAEARGWHSVEIRGSAEFKREAWIEATARGLEGRGFTPSDSDRQEADRRRAERVQANEVRAVAREETREDRAAGKPAAAAAHEREAKAKQPGERIARKAPEAMVKVTGRSRGGPGHLKAHLDYITRNGKLHAETQDGERITDRARLRDLHDDWLLANAAEARGKASPNAAQSVAIILSMPPGTPPDRVEDAARTWARETLGGKYDWLMARHDDTDHPHVHVTVRAVGYDGRRLAPGPEDLQAWRERFARELRRLGVEAEATPRQARGVVRKAPKGPVLGMERRGIEPRVRRQERQGAEREARLSTPAQPRDWSRDIQARQESIRRAYLNHADELAQGDAADRQLARDIRRFVADMPVPLTRRQAMAVELRRVLEQHPGRQSPAPSSAARPERPQRQGPSLIRDAPKPKGRG